MKLNVINRQDFKFFISKIEIQTCFRVKKASFYFTSVTRITQQVLLQKKLHPCIFKVNLQV